MFPIEPADRSESSDSQPVRDTVGAIPESRRMVGNRIESLSINRPGREGDRNSYSLSTRLIAPYKKWWAVPTLQIYCRSDLRIATYGRESEWISIDQPTG